MALDKEQARNILVKVCAEVNPHSVTPLNPDGSYFVVTPEEFDATAQAIYELGVQDERERAAKVCESSEIPIDIDVWCNSTKKEMTALTALGLAEAIRKGDTQ